MIGVAARPDVVTRVSPLGVRLWDFVIGEVVCDGLTVSVSDPGGSRASVVSNPSGVFVISGLPGLAALESGSSNAAFASSPPRGVGYRLAVEDRLGRFLPFSFAVQAPVRGIVEPRCKPAAWNPQPMPLPAVPMFSSPARSFPEGMPVVRADLWDVVADAPAAGAMLEVDVGGRTRPVRGIASAAGRVAVPLPYLPLVSGLSSRAASRAVTAQSWDVSVALFYDPLATSQALAHAAAGHPDLCALLSQPPARGLAGASPITTLNRAKLFYGADLVLRTAGDSRLLVAPTGAVA